MPIRSIELTPELDAFVSTKIASGAFRDASEVLLVALELLQRDEQDYETKMDALGQALDEGDASGIAEGDVFADVRQRLGLPVRTAVA